MEFNIVKIDKSHLQQVVDVHMRAFPNFFLTFLGPSFLKQFYISFTEDPAGIGFVAIDTKNLKVAGSVVGPLVPQGYFKRLLVRKWLAFCFASAKAVVKKPAVIKRLWNAVFYRGDAPSDQQRALLSSLSVDPDYQNKGIGRMLVSTWVEDAKKRGASGCFLTTDAENNESVNRFYKSLGWTLESTYETPQKRKMNRYIYDCMR